MWGTIPGWMGVLPAHPLLPVVATSPSPGSTRPSLPQAKRRQQGCREPGLICRSCAGSGPKHQAARLDKVVCPAGVRGRERLSCPGSSQFPLPSPRLPPWVELQNQMGAEPGGLDSSPRPMQLGQGAGAGVLPVWASLASAGGLGGHDNITGALPQIDVKLST